MGLASAPVVLKTKPDLMLYDIASCIKYGTASFGTSMCQRSSVNVSYPTRAEPVSRLCSPGFWGKVSDCIQGGPSSALEASRLVGIVPITMK